MTEWKEYFKLNDSKEDNFNLEQLFIHDFQASKEESELFEQYSDGFKLSWKQSSFDFKLEEISNYYSNMNELNLISEKFIEITKSDTK